MNEHGWSLLEVLVGTALSVLLILLIYQTFDEISGTTMQTSSHMIAASRVTMIENQLRYYISHAGLGVAQDQPVVILAKQNYLTLEANSGWYSYAAEDSFLPANNVTNVRVHDATGIKDALRQSAGSIELTILSDDKVPLVGDDEVAPKVEVDPDSIDESSHLIPVTTGQDSFFVRRGQYIGQPAQLHEFTIQNGELHVKITSVDGNEKELVLANGIEAFDTSFYYKTTDSEPEEPPAWTITVGGSCNVDFGPEHCKGYNSQAELMPFQITGGDYQVDHLNSDPWWLEANWKKRLKNLIKYADQNGIAVIIELFDENTMMGSTKWGNNPWHPNNNNMSCTELDNQQDGLPAFYQIFTNDQPNCLYNKEKGFVKSVVRSVKNVMRCGPNGNTRCRNIMFKVMNEARFNTAWDLDTFKLWHQTVGRWIENEGGYVVSANVKAFPVSAPCSGCTNEFCCLQACTDGNCQNLFDVFFQSRIHLVTLGCVTWGNVICDPNNNKDDVALTFEKPVVFDDDGTSCPRDDNINVETWAQNVSFGVSKSCGWDIGYLHFYHTGDGSMLENPPPPYKPESCKYDDSDPVDCQAWNSIADGLPIRYCRTGSTPAEVTRCVPRVDYCECFDGDCSNDMAADCQYDLVP